MCGGGGGGVGGQCVLLKTKIFIPIPTGKDFLGIITPMMQKLIAVKLIKLSDQLKGPCQDIYQEHYLLYSAPRKRFPGFLQTLHSVKEM